MKKLVEAVKFKNFNALRDGNKLSGFVGVNQYCAVTFVDNHDTR